MLTRQKFTIKVQRTRFGNSLITLCSPCPFIIYPPLPLPTSAQSPGLSPSPSLLHPPIVSWTLSLEPISWLEKWIVNSYQKSSVGGDSIRLRLVNESKWM